MIRPSFRRSEPQPLRSKGVQSTLAVAAIGVVVLLALLPFYVVLLFSLDAPQTTQSDSVQLIPEFAFSNYAEAVRASRIDRAILNSTVITAGALAVLISLGSLAGYTIGRFPTVLNKLILGILLGSMMIPGIINTVPLYVLMRQINGINTRWAMSLLLAANALPFSVFLYTGFVRAMPKDVEEAAIIDGCTQIGAFARITFHLLAPVTSAVVILNGLSIWNNYGQAVFFLQRNSVRTIPLAISLFFQQYGAQWNLMAAAAVVGVAPAVVAFLVFQRFFVKGLAAGALKG